MVSLRNKRNMERLALIKERYRTLILEPRQKIEMELDENYVEDYSEEVHAEEEGVLVEMTEDEDLF